MTTATSEEYGEDILIKFGFKSMKTEFQNKLKAIVSSYPEEYRRVDFVFDHMIRGTLYDFVVCDESTMITGGFFIDGQRNFTDKQLEEYRRLTPEADSVERWQIKVIEQYRFQLLQLAIRLAIEMGEPGYLDFPTGVDRWWSPIPALGTKEIKELQKKIDKRLRQKITPELLRKVAEIYTEAGLRNEKPVKAVQEFYKCAYRTAQDYVTYARQQSFLPPTTPGKVTVRKTKKRKGKA